MRVGAVGSRYVGNAAYNVYNKKACSNIHAHWSVAFAQLVVRLSRICVLRPIAWHSPCALTALREQVGVVWSVCLWLPGIRKLPKISGKDWIALAPIGACRMLQMKAL